MGQEQSYAHANAHRRYKEKYEEPRPSGYCAADHEDYKRHKPRRSNDSFKSDNSSNESSGYRSGSSAYEYSDRSSKNSYYCPSLYKNEHYKETNKELYKPVKLNKEKRYNTLQPFDDKDELKNARLKGYLSETEKVKPAKSSKSGIRNYTPKILSEEEQRKKLQNWI